MGSKTLDALVIAGAMVFIGAGVASAQCANAAPGRCTPAVCAARHGAQTADCASISGPPYAYFCNRNTHTRQRAPSVASNLRCLQARRYTSECFDAIDAGHRHQIESLKLGISSCGGTAPANPYNARRP